MKIHYADCRDNNKHTHLFTKLKNYIEYLF